MVSLVVIEPRTCRFGVRRSTTTPPRSPGFCRDPCYMWFFVAATHVTCIFFCRSDPCYTQNHDSCFPASNIDLSFPSVVRFVWVSTVYKLSLRMRKLRIWISDQVRHKSACTVTEAGWKLEILDLRKRGCTICVAKIKALISFAVTAKLVSASVFVHADCWGP